MVKRYSIAEARARLPAIVHEIEDGATVELTRRGRPVAVVLAAPQYLRLARQGPTFEELVDRFRSAVHDSDLGPAYFAKLRDRSPGRPVEL